MLSVEFFIKERDIPVGRVLIDHEMYDVVPTSLINTAFGATRIKLVSTNTGEEFVIEEMGGKVHETQVEAYFDDKEFEENDRIVLCITIFEK